MSETQLKQFGVFIGLFNKLNDTGMSVKAALKSPDMMELFKNASTFLKVDKDKISGARVSVKRRSLNLVDLSERRREVYEFILSNPGLTRKQIAVGSDILLQSVCGRVNELLASGHLYVCGEVYDEDTGRNVEKLKAVEDAA